MWPVAWGFAAATSVLLIMEVDSAEGKPPKGA
jgi:hypothetical protein